MPRRFSFVLWVLFAAAIALVPLACGTDDSNGDGSMSVQRPDSMTKS
jgi:hypothetical protein